MGNPSVCLFLSALFGDVYNGIRIFGENMITLSDQMGWLYKGKYKRRQYGIGVSLKKKRQNNVMAINIGKVIINGPFGKPIFRQRTVPGVFWRD